MSGLTHINRDEKRISTVTFQLDGANYYITDALDIQGGTIAWIGFPATWTAAALTALVPITTSGDAEKDYYDKRADGVWTLSTNVTGADQVVSIGIGEFVGVRKVIFQSGTTAAQVDQTAARVLSIGWL